MARLRVCKNGNIYKSVNCDVIHGSCAEINTTRRRNKIFFGFVFCIVFCGGVWYNGVNNKNSEV